MCDNRRRWREAKLSGNFFISLLNPGIGFLLATALALLWANRRDKAYVGIAAVSYAISGLAFLIQDVGPRLPRDIHLIASNLCFMMAGYTLASAILLRYELRPPHLLLSTITVIAMSGQQWFLLVEPNLAGRIYSVSFALGIMALIVAVRLYRIEKRQLTDRLLCWVAALSAANFILRPILIITLTGSFTSTDSFQRSMYWSTVQFTQAMISIMVALNLLVAVAIDLIEEIRREADTDKLSGLLNRRGFEARAGATLGAGGSGEAATLLLADLDHFKQINDSHGHAVGDRVIELFGEAVRTTIGADAVAGRIGGEEFAILLPAASLGAARQAAERLRTDFALRTAGRLPPKLVPTASIGLCVAADGETLHGLIGSADQALYRAKARGRNRLEVYAPDLTPRPELVAGS